jgi:plastocyanin
LPNRLRTDDPKRALEEVAVRSLRILALLLVTMLVALGAGCGGDDGGGDTTAATTDTSAATTTEPAGSGGGGGATTVSMDEFSFDPKDLTVTRGDTLEVKNDGAVAHNLTIEKGPDPTEKTEKLAGTPTFQGGSTEELTVDVAPGKHTMVCTVSGHRDAGMVGTITVK